MPHLVSVLLENLELFDPDIANLPVHGANLATVEMLARIVRHDAVEALEVFLPPAVMARTELLTEAAQRALPPALRGRGRLRFYPVHSIPAVWSDAKPRVLLCLDPEWLARDRYLRDRFAVGPMPITCDTHGLGHHRLWQSLTRFAAASPVSYDSIVCLSTTAARGVRAAFDGFLAPGVSEPPCRVDVIGRGVNADLFKPVDDAGKRDARRLLRLPEEGQICLYLGRVTAHGKGDLLPLVRAFAGVTNASSDFLLIAGEEYPAGYGKKLRECGNAVGLGERLLIHPKVPPALRPLYYAAADIFVFPGDTVQEMFGNTTLEAMSTGLPVVASEWDGMRDLVTEGETGHLVRTYWMPGLDGMDALSPVTPLGTEYLFVAQRVWVDTMRLADALASLLLSPERRREFGARARERVDSGLTWDHTLARWMRLWDELAAAALTEDEGQRERRRALAETLGLPTPYDHLFASYAGDKIDVARYSVRLSAHGIAVARKNQPLELYDETLSLVHNSVIDALFEALERAGSQWTIIGSLVRSVAGLSKKPDDAVLFHICMFLKRDLLELCADL